MNTILKVGLLCLLLFSQHSFAQPISIGTRLSLESDILKEERPLLIYLPPSYYSNSDQKFPVLYILDGDYNFQYVTGLIELQSSISEKIPEMIVVGISGKGTQAYRRNCKPKIEGVEDSGNASEMVQFIESELFPYMKENYKTNDYRILGGHSIGGLFVIDTAMDHPRLFNQYIAISPALWWADKAIHKKAKKIFKDNPNFKSDVYVSLADEKGMEVEPFLKIANSSFKFKQFENENHNSVGEPTYKWALNTTFEKWQVKKLYFDGSEAFKNYHVQVMENFGTDFNIPNGILGYTNYTLKKNASELAATKKIVAENYPESVAYFDSLLAGNFIENKELEEAEALLMETLAVYPQSFEVLQKLSEVKAAQNDSTQANLFIEQAIAYAAVQRVRQWQMNELIEARELLNK
ncbi:alpha/beta hydrolase-fold protein [Ulvibacter antarcticus]|uniref:Alpha/beta superfamily hydrolase n=1 Tax=Ulvibacter antarcticus TaxID=442714 RepID=A0A3L9YL75_9FLAO|nr:alpha/beta hydrolase-fold protein [Ulvibacter antarcticus]RMA58895.1 hypothetical protein BXY75_2276 [Ulvibacter antarcticus]